MLRGATGAPGAVFDFLLMKTPQSYTVQRGLTEGIEAASTGFGRLLMGTAYFSD